jgi:hypothetical protein
LTAFVASAAHKNVAIYNVGSSVSMRHVTASASNGVDQNRGVSNNGSSVTMTHVKADASGGATWTWGVYNEGDDVTLAHVTSSASTCSSECYGVKNWEGDNLVLLDVTASAGTGVPDDNDAGFYSRDASVQLTNVNATGIQGLRLYNSSEAGTHTVTLDNVTVNANWNGLFAVTDGGVLSVTVEDMTSNSLAVAGIVASQVAGTLSVSADHSRIGGFNTVVNAGSNANVSVGGSLLSGGTVVGTVTCAGVYDGSYTFYSNTCP